MTKITCDIFCTVIDNLGDAGVCWRLARQLAVEHGWQVRLWIDAPSLLDPMVSDSRPWPVEVHHWSGDLTRIGPAAVVIEAFACTLPPDYVAAMHTRACPPVWINLEYLSAEAWVIGCHGLPSPQDGLSKHFFFPGFVTGTGGLIRERSLAASPAPIPGDKLDISLFCYDTPTLPTLLDAWCSGEMRIDCHVCSGLPQRRVEAWLGAPFPAGTAATRGPLTLHAQPFLTQAGYDALLARCHLNFVRGEDSFLRTQWAERPFVWQAYPQEEDTHLAKLTAFLDLYAQQPAVRRFFLAWNGNGVIDWPEFITTLPALAAHAPAWASRIAAPGDLAGHLVEFCASRL